MLRPTKFGLKDYEKAVAIAAAQRGYEKTECEPKGGSCFAFRVYHKENLKIPALIWTVHIEHSKKKLIYPRDFAKAWNNLGISEEKFLAIIENF